MQRPTPVLLRPNPPNPYPKKSIENVVWGHILSWVYYPTGPFLTDAADPEGWVSLDRLASTRTFRNLYEDTGRRRSGPVVGSAAEMVVVIRQVMEASPDLYELNATHDKFKKAWHVVSSVVESLGL